MNGLILWANNAVSQLQILVIGLDVNNTGIGLLYFMITTAILVSASAFLCKRFSRAAAGSGLPEFKSLLGSEMRSSEYTKLVSFRILCSKIIGLILAIGSSLSIGSEGPLVHTAACMAYILMKYVPEFGGILDSPSLTKQIFAASAAVGVASAFNSPVGGLLFSVEVTSTFYLVSNYWKSFIAATSGAVACNLFLVTQQGANSDPLKVLQIANVDHPFVKWELFIFLLIGIGFGYLAHFYLKLHQMTNVFLRPYVRPHPVASAAMLGAISALLVYVSGAWTSGSVGVISNVSDVLTTGKMTAMSQFGVPRLGGLFATFLTRGFLTLIGTNTPVPAGIFMPVFLIGGILGRWVGVLLELMFASSSDVMIHVPGYALVGATAFAAGITHTISVAVIAVELTGDLKMLLPCLIAAVVAAGITKSKGLSVYDQGMLNKGLESFQLLLMESGNFSFAGDIMDSDVVSIPLSCTMHHLVKMLESTRQTVFPMMANESSQKLLGTVSRTDVFSFIKRRYTEEHCYSFIRKHLALDAHEDDERIARLKAKEKNRLRRKHLIETSKSRSSALFDSLMSSSSRYLFGEDLKVERSRHTKLRESDNDDINRKCKFEKEVEIINDVEANLHDDENSNRKSRQGNAHETVSPMHVMGEGNIASLESSPETKGKKGDGRVEFDSESLAIPSSVHTSFTGSYNTPPPLLSTDGIKSFVRVLRDVMSSDAELAHRIRLQENHEIADNSLEINGMGYSQRLEALHAEVVEVLTCPQLPVNAFPFSAADKTPIEHIYVLFEMVRVSCIFVVDIEGKLLGLISRDHLLHKLKNSESQKR